MNLRLVFVLFATAVGIIAIPMSGIVDAISPAISATSSPVTLLKQSDVMPLPITENAGQWEESVRFRVLTPGATVWFCVDGLRFRFEPSVGKPLSSDERRLAKLMPMTGVRQDAAEDSATVLVAAQFVGANSNSVPEGEGPLDVRSNYFIGDDPSKWRSDVRSFTSVVYKNVFPGIDLRYEMDGTHLKCKYSTTSVADLSKVRFLLSGDVTTAEHGLGVHGLEISPTKRVETALTVIDGVVCPPDSHSSDLTLAVSLPTSIAILYGTYLGGGSVDRGEDIAIDPWGSAYVVGTTLSANFPTSNPYQGFQRFSDIFVAKLTPGGNALDYCTFLGGNDYDDGFAIAVDFAGNAYITGSTVSSDFPLVTPIQTNLPFDDVFVTKIAPEGNALVYSTYIGGSISDYGYDIAIDREGSAYVVGATNSGDFLTVSPFQIDQPNFDAVIMKLTPSGSALAYSTYLGGNNEDYGTGIALDALGGAFVTGKTLSTDFPTVTPYQSDRISWDAFVTKLSLDGNALVYSTYLGGNDFEDAEGIAVDAHGSAYVTGSTNSTDFPTVNQFQSNRPLEDVYVCKIAPSGTTLTYSTYLGGDEYDDAFSIGIDIAGNAYVTGLTWSGNFPLAHYITSASTGSSSVFVTAIRSTGNALVYSTLLGGSDVDEGRGVALDGNGSAYVTGVTWSTAFPTVDPYQTNQASSDAFVTKLAAVCGSASLRLSYLEVRRFGSSSWEPVLPEAPFVAEVGDLIRFNGVICDTAGAPLAGRAISCYNPFLFDPEVSEDGVTSVVTSASGAFSYPPLGLFNEDAVECTESGLLPFWFSISDTSAIPYLLPISDGCDGFECLLDSVCLWLDSDIGCGAGSYVGIPDSSNFLHVTAPAYPPLYENLRDPINDDFWRVFAMNYHGPIEQTFLIDSVRGGWLHTGARLIESDMKRVADSLKDYIMETSQQVMILAEKQESGEWVKFAPSTVHRTARIDLGGILNVIQYGVEGVLCVAAFPAGCAPLAIHVATDVVKEKVVPYVCRQDFISVSQAECETFGKAGVEVAGGIVSLVATGGLSGHSIAKHSTYWAGKLGKYEKVRSSIVNVTNNALNIHETVDYAWNVTSLIGKQYSYAADAVGWQSAGFEGLEYVNPSAVSTPMYGLRVDIAHSIIAPPQLRTDFSVDIATDAFSLEIESDRAFYDLAGVSPVAPTVTVSSLGMSAPIPMVITGSGLHQGTLPLSLLPGYVGGQNYNSTIAVHGLDLMANAGSSTDSYGFGMCVPSQGFQMSLENLTTVSIPPNAVSEQTQISIGPAGSGGEFGYPPGPPSAGVDGFDFPVGYPDGAGWGIGDCLQSSCTDQSCGPSDPLRFLEPNQYPRSGCILHPAEDWNLPGATDCGEDVHAIANGKVVGECPTTGTLVIRHDGVPGYGTVWSAYTHMTDIERHPPNDVVNRGDVIGKVSNTGAEGCHLHLEIRLNPDLPICAFPKEWKRGGEQSYIMENYLEPTAFIVSQRALTEPPSRPVRGSGLSRQASVQSDDSLVVYGELTKILPVGLDFDTAAMITLPYDFSELFGILVPHIGWFNPATQSWQDLGGTDNLDGTVSAQIFQTGLFTILIEEIKPCACDCHADPSCDGVTDIFDVTQAINLAFRGGDQILDPNLNCPRQTTDVNCDGVTNIFDVTHFINVAFRGGDPEVDYCNPCP